MQHSITTTVVNTPTGTPGSTDGVMMLICQGVAATSGEIPLDLETAYLGSTLADFTDRLGVTKDYDYVNSVNVYKQVKEFYDEAGDGAYLWLVVTDDTAYTTYVASTTFKNLVRGTIQSDPAMRAKMIGFTYPYPATTQSSTDFPSDVLSAIPVLQTTQEDLFAEGFQYSQILDGYRKSTTATSSTTQTMATKNAPSVSLCITSSKPDGIASVGAALGRFARITVGHGFGAVEDGAIAIQKAYLTNGARTDIHGTAINQGTNLTADHSYMVLKGPVTYNGTEYSFGETFTVITGTLGFTGTGTTVVDLTTTASVTAGHTYYVEAGPITYNSVDYATGELFTAVTGVTTFTGGVIFEAFATDVTSLYNSDLINYGAKQYMFLRYWFSQSGLFWNDGGTCNLATKPLSTQEFNRVANKASADVLAFLTLLMGKSIPIDVKTGKAALTFTTAKQQDFFDTYLNPLIVSQDISGGSLTLEGTRNGVNTINWTYTLTINGNPITGSVTGQVKFV